MLKVYIISIISILIIGYQFKTILTYRQEISQLNNTINKLNEMTSRLMNNEKNTNNALDYLNKCKLNGCTNEADIFNNINNMLFNNK